jgi:hypothetical protein
MDGRKVDAASSRAPSSYGCRRRYILSSAALRWLAASDEVLGWVRDALGGQRDALQWQKFEDTTTGYWLTYAPERVHYVNIGYWLHDLRCEGPAAADGAKAAARRGIYRPPANYSLLVRA